MNRRTLWMSLVVMSSLFYVGCGCGSSLKVEITQAPTTVMVGQTASVTATVTHDKAAGGVNWSCTPVGTCGTFNPSQTASGVASVYTAPAAAGTVTIVATSVDKPSVSASVSVTITTTTVTTSNFVFYVTGEENNTFGDNYCIAGVVSIATTASADGSFAVTGGEQDYNDGDGITSHEPSGDLITGGSLAFNSGTTGNGTLTLITNDDALGVSGGTEIFAVVFPNGSHALITQFDGSATSSGSLDLQSSTALPSAAFSFAAAGADPTFFPVAFGGVFSVGSGGTLSGTFDVNDSGAEPPVLGTAIPAGAMVGTPDNLGRGAVTGSGISTSLVYYVVGTEVLRLIDVDAGDNAVGSAYGHGDFDGSFSSGEIGPSVFSIWNWDTGYAAVGQFTTSAAVGAAKPETACGTGLCSFIGVGDLNQPFSTTQVELSAQAFNGTYMINTSGYGSMGFFESFGNSGVETFGIYAVDPTLNILDPNDKADGLGGALIAEMDSNLVGIGSIVPQTDTTTASFSGTYAFGGQGDTTTNGDEFDFLGTASVSGLDFAGTGPLSDPFGALSGNPNLLSSVTFMGTATPDSTNPGRYTFSPLELSNDSFTAPIDLTVAAYQAYGGQLFWIDTDVDVYFGGSLELVPPTPSAAKKAKPNNRKH